MSKKTIILIFVINIRSKKRITLPFVTFYDEGTQKPIGLTGSTISHINDLLTTFLIMPDDCTAGISAIRVYGTALVGEGVGEGQMARMNMRYGADGEVLVDVAYNTKVSESKGFGVNEIIHWEWTPVDDALIGAVRGGDYIGWLIFRGIGAAGANGATNAVVTAVEIEYS